VRLQDDLDDAPVVSVRTRVTIVSIVTAMWLVWLAGIWLALYVA
jgi:hypothetical protein